MRLLCRRLLLLLLLLLVGIGGGVDARERVVDLQGVEAAREQKQLLHREQVEGRPRVALMRDRRAPRVELAPLRRHQRRERDDAFASFGGGSQKECYNCGQLGHISRDCPNAGSRDDAFASFGGGRSSDRACYNCGQSGHKSAECPN